LQGQWLETIVYNIRMCLGDVGKGWFDINVYNHEIYEVSKLKRFMELIKFRMQYTLRILVLNSIELFIDLVETPCLPCLEVEEDFVWGPNLIESDFVSKASAIFILQLKMDDNGAFYSTVLENFEKVLLKLYDTGLTLTHKIKQVHPYLLNNLNFPNDLMLSSVGLLAEEVVSVRERFIFAYKKALIPLRAFASEFYIYLELFTLDVKAYVE
jgi:dynein heavy chain